MTMEMKQKDRNKFRASKAYQQYVKPPFIVSPNRTNDSVWYLWLRQIGFRVRDAAQPGQVVDSPFPPSLFYRGLFLSLNETCARS